MLVLTDKIRFLDLKVMMPSQTRRLTRHSQSQSEREKGPDTLRYYRWTPSAVTLGHFQSVRDEVNLDTLFLLP